MFRSRARVCNWLFIRASFRVFSLFGWCRKQIHGFVSLLPFAGKFVFFFIHLCLLHNTQSGRHALCVCVRCLYASEVQHRHNDPLITYYMNSSNAHRVYSLFMLCTHILLIFLFRSCSSIMNARVVHVLRWTLCESALIFNSKLCESQMAGLWDWWMRRVGNLVL